MSARSVYMDETKRAGYVVAAVSVDDLDAARQGIRGLVLPGQRRLHMHSEQARRRRVIVSAVAALEITATIYDAGRNYDTDAAARAACLAALIGDLAATGGGVRLVIEQDDSLVRSDNQRLVEITRTAGMRGTLQYEHRRAFEEPLLALPDIVAWCWVRSAEWRRRVHPILGAVRRV